MKHKLATGFRQAAKDEIRVLEAKNTWTEVLQAYAKEQNIKTILTRWVFKYKFDQEGFLIKQKARLCARGNLQKTSDNTYAATLASRIFQAMMAITAAFDYET